MGPNSCQKSCQFAPVLCIGLENGSNFSYTLNNGPNNKIFFGKCPLAFCLSLGKVRIVISLLGNELKIIEKNPLFKKGIPFLKRGYTSAC